MDDEVPKAELRAMRDGAGELWWGNFIKQRSKDIDRRFKQTGAIYFHPAERMPTDLFSYTREASLCFSVARYLATIVLSSSAVELILNRDRRTKAHGRMLRTREGWATLNSHNLRIIQDEGLPATALLSSDENLANDKRIVFVNRRNRVAHGELSNLVHGVADYDPGAEKEASDQLQKSDRFVIEWFNTSPDVQNGAIKNYCWPE